MMNDTEFENILKQALRPDISDEEILIKETPSRSKRRKSTMRKHRIIQSAIAAAACLALIWGGAAGLSDMILSLPIHHHKGQIPLL